MKNSCKKAVVIAAHPDDEILGCGGSIAKMTSEGIDVHVLILGQGLAARGKRGSGLTRSLKELRTCGQKANKAVGSQEVVFLDFPDNRFDTVPMLDIVKSIETFLNKVRANTVFTHSAKDLNIDHQITARAVMSATRPLPGSFVGEVYAFEVLSSSEWNFGESFSPNVFIDISAHIEAKKKAISEYTSEIKEYPHPRSQKGVEILASYRGMQAGLSYAEAFSLVRSIK